MKFGTGLAAIGAELTESILHPEAAEVLGIADVAIPLIVALILYTTIVLGKPETAERVFRLLRWIRNRPEPAASDSPSSQSPAATEHPPAAERPVTIARVTEAQILGQMRDLAGAFTAAAEQLTGTVTALGDPTASEAEVEAARADAERRAAAHDAEAERIRAEARARVEAAAAERDTVVEHAEADKVAATANARERSDRTEAQEAIRHAQATEHPPTTELASAQITASIGPAPSASPSPSAGNDLITRQAPTFLSPSRRRGRRSAASTVQAAGVTPPSQQHPADPLRPVFTADRHPGH